MKRFFAGAALALLVPAAAFAQTAPAGQASSVDEVTVTGRDAAGLLERQPSDTVFGISKPLLDTPRSATFVSAATLDRYGVLTLDDLTAVSPGTYTDSYYGVAGSLNLRGSLAENYFRGFKRVEDRGTYPTPIPAADEIDIVRGPPSSIYGPGKVGGFMNFEPKTARVENHFLDAPTGEAEVTGGSYGLTKFSGQLGAPVKLGGGVDGGVYAYAEAQNAGSYYHGIDPRHQLIETSADFDLGSGWTTAFGGMGYWAKGNIQTPGWNRLTQALIDNGTYITGRNTALVATNGANLTPANIGPGGLIQGYFGFPPYPDRRFALSTGVGTMTLSSRTVFVSNADFSNTDTATAYYDLARKLGEGQLKVQLFYDDLSNQRFVSYGFPADYHAHVEEARASWTTPFAVLDGLLHGQSVIGAAVRGYRGTDKESSNGGNLSLDRRDIAYGATPTDILSSPFDNEAGEQSWETDVRSHWTDTGLFGVADLSWSRLTLTLGGRYDAYDVTSSDHGTLVFGATPGQTYSDSKGKWTYNVSLAWKAPFGLMPYLTYADASALEVNQAGGLAPSLVAGKSWLSSSLLDEAGVKARLWGDILTGSLAAYRQARTELSINNGVQDLRSDGVELELRWLATRTLSFTFAGDVQRTRVKGPDGSFILVPPATVGVNPINGYGGAYALYTVSTLIPGDYTDTLIPHSVASLYAVYTAPRQDWGQAGATAGFTAVSSTQGVVPAAVHLPAYATIAASAFLQHDAWRLSVNVDNLLDKRYFTPDADVLAEVAVLPGIGRTWRVALRRSF